MHRLITVFYECIEMVPRLLITRSISVAMKVVGLTPPTLLAVSFSKLVTIYTELTIFHNTEQKRYPT